VAFWNECADPVINGMFRQVVDMKGWTFGSAYVPEEGNWPAEDAHNAREAEWARGQTAETVVARLDAAHADARRVLETVTDDELTDERFARYVAEQADHYLEHARGL
jgi:hypothetical protein